MRKLLVIGGGLFGAQAAAYASSRGIESIVFDADLPGAASPAAGGLFRERWVGHRLREDWRRALPVLDSLYGIRHIELTGDDGGAEPYLFVPPSAILRGDCIRQRVTQVGDGWLQAGGKRHAGWIYVAAGIWSEALVPGIAVHGKAGASFLFEGERQGRVRHLSRNQQAFAFVRDAGSTFFSDGTAERVYTDMHEARSLARAADFGLLQPMQRMWGWRPYTPGGPLFRRVGERTWVATGGRKLGTVLGAAFAWRLVEEELQHA